MSVPQIRVALAGCDRRDAALALQNLDTVHAAVAPLLVGEKGGSAFDRCASALKAIIRPLTPAEKKKNSLFSKLLALVAETPRPAVPPSLPKPETDHGK
jgi:hypothetical protein